MKSEQYYEQYYEERAKEFYELKLGSMTMKDLNNKFLSLLRYVPYLVDEKPKVQRFLSCLPYHIKDRIEYDNPKTLEEAMRKANFCFEQNKKKEGIGNWKAKKKSNQPEFKKKEFQVEPEGEVLVELDCILRRREITLRNRIIGPLKVQWKHLSLEEATWELESKMQEAYPNLFQEVAKDEE